MPVYPGGTMPGAVDPARFNPPRTAPGPPQQDGRNFQYEVRPSYNPPPAVIIEQQRPSYTPPPAPVAIIEQRPSYTPPMQPQVMPGGAMPMMPGPFPVTPGIDTMPTTKVPTGLTQGQLYSQPPAVIQQNSYTPPPVMPYQQPPVAIIEQRPSYTPPPQVGAPMPSV